MSQMAVWCKPNFLALIVVLEHLRLNLGDVRANLNNSNGIFLPWRNKSHPWAVGYAAASLNRQRLAVAGVPSLFPTHTRAVPRVLSGSEQR